MANKLTPADLDLLGRARELAGLNDPAAHFGPDLDSSIDNLAYAQRLTAAQAEALGRMQYLLAELADLAERLGGQPCE